MEEINLIKEIRELKSQLSYAKNIGFLWGLVLHVRWVCQISLN